jgi:hypothetical protein
MKSIVNTKKPNFICLSYTSTYTMHPLDINIINQYYKLHFVVNFDIRETHLLWIETTIKGKGYGHLALAHMFLYLLKHNIDFVICLDDMTTSNRNDSIYVKNGFKYIDDTFPEMQNAICINDCFSLAYNNFKKSIPDTM